MSEFVNARSTPSIRRKVSIASSETSVGQIVFGQLNTASRPPKAPSATR